MLEINIEEFLSIPAHDNTVDKFKVGSLVGNQSKNRYPNILPYDNNLVSIIDKDKKTSSKYINASFIKLSSVNNENVYIATQGPLQETIEDFWSMIFHQDVRLIVMLTEFYDRQNPGQEKCAQYFDENNNQMEFDEFTLLCNLVTLKPSYMVRKFTLVNLKLIESRDVFHLQFTKWHDMQVPEMDDFLDFYQTYLQYAHDCCLHSPIVVHCSAGIGRTGTFLLFLYLVELLRRENHPDLINIDPCQLVREMRQQRMGMVETCDQFTFSCKAALSFCEKLYQH